MGRSPSSATACGAPVSTAVPSALGRSLTIDGQAYSIDWRRRAAVPAACLIERSPDLWISSGASSAAAPADGCPLEAWRHGRTGAGRAGGAFPSARAATAWTRARGTYRQPLRASRSSPRAKGSRQLRAQYERPLLALTGLVTLVLLITCTNVGNLLMVRNSARRRELAVRAALGARRSRLVLQYLVESAMLAALGRHPCAGRRAMGRLDHPVDAAAAGVAESLAFQLDARVLGFAAGVSLLSALLFGLAPAWRAAQVDLTAALRSSQGNSSTKRTPPPRPHAGGLPGGLVGAPAGRRRTCSSRRCGTWRASTWASIPSSLLQVSLDTRGSGYREGQVGGLYRLLLERVSAIPGVLSVTGIRNAVMRGESQPRPDGSFPASTLDRRRGLGPGLDVGPSFFETMNIPVVRGRTFTAADFAQERRSSSSARHLPSATSRMTIRSAGGSATRPHRDHRRRPGCQARRRCARRADR